MKGKKEKGDLRARAEALIAGRPSDAPADIRTYNEVFHELLVHDDRARDAGTRSSQGSGTSSKNRGPATRTSIDAAPVAYLTFDENGRVLESKPHRMRARLLLDVDRRGLDETFSRFRHPGPADQDILYKHRLEVLKKGINDIATRPRGGNDNKLYVSVESIDNNTQVR